MKVNDLIMNELSEEKSTELWLQLRKDSVEFDDLCDARDSIVRIQEPYIIVNELLEAEIKKWDEKISNVFTDHINSETQ